MVLDHQQDEWVSVYDAVGEGTDVTDVDFQILTDSGRHCVLIGWEQGSSENTNISVYDYTGSQLRVLFESEYSQTVSYTHLDVYKRQGIRRQLFG